MSNKIAIFLLGISIVCVCLISCTSFKVTRNDSEASCPHYFDSSINRTVYTFVDEMPKYGEGENDFVIDFMKMFKYPQGAEIQFTINMEVIIDGDGRILRCSIKDKNVEEYTMVEKEALKTLQRMVKWKGGVCNGKIVPVKIDIPFKIN